MKLIIDIPENPTNGDMIKALFSAKIYQGGGLTNCLFQPNAFLEDRTSEWWNAPYKNGVRFNILGKLRERE